MTESTYSTEAGSLLKAWRTSHHISLYHFAVKSKLRIETISHIENGDGKTNSFLTYLETIRTLNEDDYLKIIQLLFED